jgi:hypothetical protein
MSRKPPPDLLTGTKPQARAGSRREPMR